MTQDWEIKPGETPPDLDGFKHIKKFPNPSRTLVDELEEENIRKATLKYLSKRPSEKEARFDDYYWLLQLHEEMLGDVYDWAGKTRKADTSIGTGKHMIGEELRALAVDIPKLPEHIEDPIEVAMQIHHRAVKIHPFKNGNGRWSRLLANIWLKQNGHPMIEWPAGLDKESPVRGEYIEAVKAADNMDYEPLLELHRKFVQS